MRRLLSRDKSMTAMIAPDAALGKRL